MLSHTSLLDKQQNELQSVIYKEIEKFSSDKTGKTDFALESIGIIRRKTDKT